MKTILRMGLLLSLFISLHTPTQALEIKEVFTVDDWLSIDVRNTVLLMNDLDFDGVDYIPIAQFNGTIDGQGHTLKNVEISLSIDSTLSNVGLFGQLSGASIRNLNVDAMRIHADIEMVSVGSIAGRALNSSLENISITNTTLISSYNAGGLIGTIEPLDPWAEGLEPNEVQITQTSFNGSITAALQVGGLIGSINHSSHISITESFSKGSLTAMDNAGFMVGEILSSVVSFRDVYSKMEILALEDPFSQHAFGWIGYRMFGGSGHHALSIDHAYQQTTIQGLELHEFMHAWVGVDTNEFEAVLQDIYYYRDTLFVDDVGMKTSDELLQRSTYVDFDFNHVWLMDASLNDGYPLLQHEVFSVTIHPNNGNDIEASNHIKNSVITLPEYSYEGHTLKAWYLDEALTMPFDLTNTYHQDMNLYAKWTMDPIDEVIVKEPVVQEPSNPETNPEAPIPVQELVTSDEQPTVIIINKPIVVTPVKEESTESELESNTNDHISDSEAEEQLITPVLLTVDEEPKGQSWCWLWWLLVLLIIYIIHRKLNKRELVDNA